MTSLSCNASVPSHADESVVWYLIGTGYRLLVIKLGYASLVKSVRPLRLD